MPRTTPNPVVRAGAALAALLACAAPAAAQQAPAGLTLDQAVSSALQGNKEVLTARAQLTGGRGELLSASAPFDVQLDAQVRGVQDSRFLTTQSGTLASDATVSRSTAYTLSATRQLRSGVVVAPSVGVTRTTVAGAQVADAASTVNLAVVLPLLRDRGGRAVSAPERAARAGFQAYNAGVRQGVILGAADAAVDYWDYVAAQSKLQVMAGAEARAARLVDETRRLVEADERPRADLDAVSANLANRRAGRIAAEQALAAARRALGAVMGLEPLQIETLPAPVTPFPTPAAWVPDSAETRRLVEAALVRRPDLEAAALQLRAAEIMAEGTRSQLKPRLDVRVEVGYTGRQLGPAAAGQLVRPLWESVPGVNAGVRVDYQLPVQNRDARGAVLQREALVEEQRITTRDQRVRAVSGVIGAVQTLASSAAQLSEAERAVGLYRAAVEHEREKNRLSAGTLFDVTYAEDNLTSAELAVVDAQLAHAHALLTIRLVTGTVLDPQTGTVNADAFVTRP
ncbi:MAG TPA: TolC family protein [Longimicrobium sp.]|nr:TolC family protein [Longimicrobium sp.]